MIVDICSVIAVVSVVVFFIFSYKLEKKQCDKVVEECNIRIEFYKVNYRLTDEIENLWTAIAYDKYGIYMNEEVGRKAAELNEQE